MRELIQAGDDLDLQEDKAEQAPTLRKEMEDWRNSIVVKYGPSWSNYPQDLQNGLLMCEASITAMSADWKTHFFQVKLIDLILLHELRAHESGAYIRNCDHV